MKISQDIWQKRIERGTCFLIKKQLRDDVELNHVVSLLLFPNSSRQSSRSIRSGESGRLQASKRRDWSSYEKKGGGEGEAERVDSRRDPRSRLLRPEDGEREFAFTRKNLCHSFSRASTSGFATPRLQRAIRFASAGELILSFAYQVARAL